MASIREWLDEAGFDWSSGRIIHHYIERGSPGWYDATGAEEVGRDSEVLNREFYAGYGGPQCPRFVAEDSERIYFPSQYDGATELVAVWKDLSRYLDWRTNDTPYPGG